MNTYKNLLKAIVQKKGNTVSNIVEEILNEKILDKIGEKEEKIAPYIFVDKEEITEETVKEFSKKLLDKMGIDSIKDLDVEGKKKFFNTIDKEFKAVDEEYSFSELADIFAENLLEEIGLESDDLDEEELEELFDIVYGLDLNEENIEDEEYITEIAIKKITGLDKIKNKKLAKKAKIGVSKSKRAKIRKKRLKKLNKKFGGEATRKKKQAALAKSGKTLTGRKKFRKS